MQVIEIFNRAVMLLFLLCYSYQFFYLAASLLKKPKRAPETGAVLYDEQPTRFSQSWRQRLRWSKGYLQVLGRYGTVFVLGAVTTATEWRSIGCSGGKKIFYALTFPLFMFTYIPICAASFFVRSEWKPIRHDRCLTLRQICPEYDRERSA